MPEVRLITLDPGHFHACLVQTEMYPGVSRLVHVYAPLGTDLLTHLERISRFNGRRDQPTNWELEVHAGPDPLARLLRDRPGNVVVLSGQNRGKIDSILAVIEAGMNVLADKPWIIRADDLPKLKRGLDAASQQGLIAHDMMTERFEITSVLQRELVNDPETFGAIQAGSSDDPGVTMASVHYLMKRVAGVPLRRPAWFFDVDQQGEGLTNVGTHLVDLVMWILFPGEAFACRDIQIIRATRWPTAVTQADFEQMTGEAGFAPCVETSLAGGKLYYFCNTCVSYTIRGFHVRLDVRWDIEAPVGRGDTHNAIFRGGRSSVDVRQGPEQNFRPELYVVPSTQGDREGVRSALQDKITQLSARWPGLALAEEAGEFRVVIPDAYRVGHEAHFGEVTRNFLRYLAEPQAQPPWEGPNMLAKYFTTTEGARLAKAAR